MILRRLFYRFRNYSKSNPILAIHKAFLFVLLVPYRKLVYPYILFRNVQLQSRQPVPSNVKALDAIIVSPGGVGTTTIMKHLSEYLSINDPHDRDLLKHIHNEKILDALTSKKLIFVYGDVYDSYYSLVKRGWLSEQVIKLGGSPNIYTKEKLFQEFLKLAQAQINLFKKLNRHSSNILLIHYDDVWDNATTIRDFLDINDPKFIDLFPKKRDRNVKPY